MRSFARLVFRLLALAVIIVLGMMIWQRIMPATHATLEPVPEPTSPAAIEGEP